MKLSEAIRLGPTIAPAIYGPVFKRDWLGRVCGACRAGATALAAGYQPSRLGLRDWKKVSAFLGVQWPWVQQLRGTYPFQAGVAVGLAILHEMRRMPANEIATYVEQLEEKYDPSSIRQVESQPLTTVEGA
jgi:hypothetical protein